MVVFIFFFFFYYVSPSPDTENNAVQLGIQQKQINEMSSIPRDKNTWHTKDLHQNIW